MLSVTCLQMSDISVICRITSITYSFQFMSAFLPHRSARPRSSILGLANIGHWMLPKIWLDFLYWAYRPGNDFEFILIHPVEGSLGSEFRAICNLCELMAAWSHKTLKFCEKFLRFWGKTTPYGKLFKILLLVSFHRDTDWRWYSNFCEIWPTENRRNCALFTRQKIRLPLKLSLLCGMCPKSARANTQQVSRFHPNQFTFGQAIATRMQAWTLPNCPVK